MSGAAAGGPQVAPVSDVRAPATPVSRLTRAQVSGPGSASVTSSSGSTPPSRCFSDARITARILANSSVADRSGSLPRWSSASPAGVRSLMARSSSRSPDSMPSTVREPDVAARAPGQCLQQPAGSRWRADSLGPSGRQQPAPTRPGRPGTPPSLATKPEPCWSPARSWRHGLQSPTPRLNHRETRKQGREALSTVSLPNISFASVDGIAAGGGRRSAYDALHPPGRSQPGRPEIRAGRTSVDAGQPLNQGWRTILPGMPPAAFALYASAARASGYTAPTSGRRCPSSTRRASSVS